jgi:hypothetical protein
MVSAKVLVLALLALFVLPLLTLLSSAFCGNGGPYDNWWSARGAMRLQPSSCTAVQRCPQGSSGAARLCSPQPPRIRSIGRCFLACLPLQLIWRLQLLRLH